MIEARIDKENEKDRVEVHGTLLEIVAAAATIISVLYMMFLEEAGPEEAEQFKEGIIDAVAGEGSPVWQLDENVID